MSISEAASRFSMSFPSRLGDEGPCPRGGSVPLWEWGPEHPWGVCCPSLSAFPSRLCCNPLWSSATLPSPVQKRLVLERKEEGRCLSKRPQLCRFCSPRAWEALCSIYRGPKSRSGVQILLRTVSWQAEVKCCLQSISSPLVLLSAECGPEHVFCLGRKTALQGTDINIWGGTFLSSTWSASEKFLCEMLLLPLHPCQEAISLFY